MAPLDKILLWIFGGFTVLGIGIAIFAISRAMKSANYRDEGLRMVFWAIGALAGLILAGMSVAYVILPILIAYTD